MIDRWKNNRGIALFIVLWVLMLLWVIVGEFSFTVRSQVNIVGNFKDATKARYYAVAGVNQAVASIIAYNASQSGKERDTLEREISAEIDQASEGGYSVKILNENGKININTANKRLLEVMLMAARVDETLESVIVDSILDWRDENDLHRSNGAENDYYQGLENPYKCRNGDFRATNELLLVRGVTEAIYQDLKDIITVYGGGDSGQSGGIIKGAGGQGDENKININFVPRGLLSALPGMTKALADQILAYRERESFNSVAELQNLIDDERMGRIAPYLTVSRSPFYFLEAVGFFKGSSTKSIIEALVEIDENLENGYRVVRWVER